MKTKLILFLLCLGINVYSQPCSNDTLVEGACTFVDQNPPIQAGQVTTRCFVIQPQTDFFSFGFLYIQSPSCGPIAYSYLNYVLYDSSCTNIITSGQIFPVPNNANISVPTYPNTFNICFTWMPLYEQTSICPTYNVSPLPVELLYFKGEYYIDKISLKWSTATENNCEKYIIEKSFNLEKWQLVGTQLGQGNSINTITYNMFDDEPIDGVNYYRLTQVDYNGNYEIFPVIAVMYNKQIGYNGLKNWNLLGQKIK